jgi:hypothetical protein
MFLKLSAVALDAVHLRLPKDCTSNILTTTEYVHMKNCGNDSASMAENRPCFRSKQKTVKSTAFLRAYQNIVIKCICLLAVLMTGNTSTQLLIGKCCERP